MGIDYPHSMDTGDNNLVFKMTDRISWFLRQQSCLHDHT